MSVVTNTVKANVKNAYKKPVVFDSKIFVSLRNRLKAYLENYQINFSPDKNIVPLVDKFTCKIDISSLISIVPYFQVSPKIYWQSRDDSLETLALGAVYKIKAPLIEDTQHFLRYSGHYGLRFYGALPFESPNKLRGKWKEFKNTHFFLPRFEFTQKNGQYFFFAYFLPKKISELWEEFDKLESSFHFSEEINIKLPKASITKQTPNARKWIKLVNTIKKYIHEGIIDKLVLGRFTKGKFHDLIDISHFLQELSKDLKKNYIFLFQSGDSSFLSFSPEKLFEVRSDVIVTEAIAGSECTNSTRSFKGDTKNTKNNKKQALPIEPIMNPKNIREQKIVEDEILAHLKKISNGLYSGEQTQILNLGYIKHIRSTFHTIMRKFYTISELLSLFHPTSAVCGAPKDSAKKLISKLERFQRGLYAAPCGFFSAMEAEFAVGIRSILIKKKKIYFFSGTGIIEDSSPESEWQELNDKLRPFQSLFNSDDL